MKKVKCKLKLFLGFGEAVAQFLGALAEAAMERVGYGVRPFLEGLRLIATEKGFEKPYRQFLQNVHSHNNHYRICKPITNVIVLQDDLVKSHNHPVESKTHTHGVGTYRIDGTTGGFLCTNIFASVSLPPTVSGAFQVGVPSGMNGNLADDEGLGYIITLQADKDHGWTGASDTANSQDFVTVQNNTGAENRPFNSTIRIWRRIA